MSADIVYGVLKGNIIFPNITKYYKILLEENCKRNENAISLKSYVTLSSKPL
jgi:hypothetical protein